MRVCRYMLCSVVFVSTCTIKAPPYVSSEDRNDFFRIARYGEPDEFQKFSKKNVRKILKRTVSRTGRSALHHAAAYGNTNVVTHIIKTASVTKHINEFDAYGRSPLYEAITRRHYDIAQLLSTHGAALRLGKNKSYTLRAHARMCGNQQALEAIDEYLISQNSDTKCCICFEKFDNERRKNITDDQCLGIICCFCKVLCDKCPLCREKLS